MKKKIKPFISIYKEKGYILSFKYKNIYKKKINKYCVFIEIYPDSIDKYSAKKNNQMLTIVSCFSKTKKLKNGKNKTKFYNENTVIKFLNKKKNCLEKRNLFQELYFHILYCGKISIGKNPNKDYSVICFVLISLIFFAIAVMEVIIHAKYWEMRQAYWTMIISPLFFFF